MADMYEPEFPSGAGFGRAREPEPAVSGRSPVEVIKDIVANIQEIMRAEFRLARAEMSEKARSGSRAGILVAAGAVMGLYALAFLLVTAYNALAMVMPAWISALIIGVVLGAAAAILLAVGIKKFKQLNPRPDKTVASVKEDVEWLKTRTK
jgi:hypothetical protein